jgi:hypothetical protein
MVMIISTLAECEEGEKQSGVSEKPIQKPFYL